MTGLRAMPVLPVRDVADAAAFYRDRLGFEVNGIWPDAAGETPNFAIVGLGAVTVALQWNAEAAPSPHWAAYLYVDDVDAYHEGLVARGVAVLSPPSETFYGIREMEVADLDGHRLAFGQDCAPGPLGPGL